MGCSGPAPLASRVGQKGLILHLTHHAQVELSGSYAQIATFASSALHMLAAASYHSILIVNVVRPYALEARTEDAKLCKPLMKKSGKLSQTLSFTLLSEVRQCQENLNSTPTTRANSASA
jgi:hypothetical protein